MSDFRQTPEKLSKIVDSLVEFTTVAIDQDWYFDYRNFYGDSFSLLLLQQANRLDSVRKNKLIDHYMANDFSNPEFHWEFNNYALNQWEDLQLTEQAFWRRPLRFKNTPCTNWTILRAAVKIRMGTSDRQLALESLLDLLHSRQLPSGLILDDLGVRSFQYHCFSACLLGEIFQLTVDQRIEKHWRAAYHFILPFILPNGDFNYIGRGQGQSFGYSSAVYLLAQAIVFDHQQSLFSVLAKIVNYLEKAMRPLKIDGQPSLLYLPLMVGKQSSELTPKVDLMNERFCGWYPYNNFFDYLPFSTVFLQKTLTLISTIAIPNTISPQAVEAEDYVDRHFQVINKEKYTAILSKPGGYISNDLLIPLIFDRARQNFVTPIHGGEQFQVSPYRLLDLPSPQWRSFTMRKRCLSWRLGSFLILLNYLGVSIYRYSFMHDSVIINEWILSPLPLKGTIALTSSWSRDETGLTNGFWSLKTNSPLSFLREVYNAHGKAFLYMAKRFNKYVFLRESYD